MNWRRLVGVGSVALTTACGGRAGSDREHSSAAGESGTDGRGGGAGATGAVASAGAAAGGGAADSDPAVDGGAGGTDGIAGLVNVDCDVVNFPDPALDALVREVLDIPEGPITSDQLDELTELNRHAYASGTYVANLEGLQCATQLEILGLSNSEIEALSPLRRLFSLKELDLSGTFRDVEPLANLTNLEVLDLQSGALESISALAQLTRLVQLNVTNNQLTSLTGVEGMTRLESLWAAHNQLTDLAPLAWLSCSNALGCCLVSLDGNPLDQAALDDHIPQMCDSGMSVSWDEGECYQCINPP